MYTLSTALPEETQSRHGVLMAGLLLLAVGVAFAVSAFVPV
jgi:hypothetical protein